MTELSSHCFNSEASNLYTALQYHFLPQDLNRPNFVKILAARAAADRDNADIHELTVLKNKYTDFVNQQHPGHGELLFDKLILE